MLVRMCVLCVVCADSLRRVAQEKMVLNSFIRLKRMIGGLGNVLFSTCSQTLNVLEHVMTLRGPSHG